MRPERSVFLFCSLSAAGFCTFCQMGSADHVVLAGEVLGIANATWRSAVSCCVWTRPTLQQPTCPLIRRTMLGHPGQALSAELNRNAWNVSSARAGERSLAANSARRGIAPGSEADDGFETVCSQRPIRHLRMLEHPAAALCGDSSFNSCLFFRHDRCTRSNCHHTTSPPRRDNSLQGRYTATRRG